MVSRRQPMRFVFLAVTALLVGVGALRGPGGLECKTAKECNALAARERAILQASREAAKAEADKLEADAVRSAGGQVSSGGSGSDDGDDSRGGNRDDDPPAARAGRAKASKVNVKSNAAMARAQQQQQRGSRSSGNGPQHIARFACAVVLVSGPSGLRFASDEHVERFKQNAKGGSQRFNTCVQVILDNNTVYPTQYCSKHCE